MVTDEAVGVAALYHVGGGYPVRRLIGGRGFNDKALATIYLALGPRKSSFHIICDDNVRRLRPPRPQSSSKINTTTLESGDHGCSSC